MYSELSNMKLSEKFVENLHTHMGTFYLDFQKQIWGSKDRKKVGENIRNMCENGTGFFQVTKIETQSSRFFTNVACMVRKVRTIRESCNIVFVCYLPHVETYDEAIGALSV